MVQFPNINFEALERAVKKHVKKNIPLGDYYQKRYPSYDFAPHLQRLIGELEQLKPKEAIILNLPPRHGKSDSVAAFLEWRLGRNPTESIIYSSYSASLAYKRSRIVRNEIDTGLAFPQVFTDVKLIGDARAVAFWETQQGGAFIASGVGGSITGMGASLAIIDDPVKGRKEAESSVIREAAIDWFTSDLITRLTPNANLVIVQTRWHADDLAGWVLKQIKKDPNFAGFNWKTLVMPAINDAGKALWPNRYSLEWLEKRRNANEFDFASLYQQTPIPRGGTVFREAYYYSELPKEKFKKAIAVDLAYTSKKHADSTVILAGLYHEGKLYITQMQRLQTEAAKTANALKQLQRDFPAEIYTRTGGQEKAVIELFHKEGLRITYDSTVGDKYSNAQPVATAWNRGLIMVPENARWLEDFLGEVLNFTGVSDSRDDAVDALVTLHNSISIKETNLDDIRDLIL